MKRPAKNGDEQDCFYARKWLKVFKRAGIASKTKKRFRRKERRMMATNDTKQTNIDDYLQRQSIDMDEASPHHSGDNSPNRKTHSI